MKYIIVSKISFEIIMQYIYKNKMPEDLLFIFGKEQLFAIIIIFN